MNSLFVPYLEQGSGRTRSPLRPVDRYIGPPILPSLEEMIVSP
ncbi:hypothetical protein [Novosphingobium resinovorum]|nr:hypothetical protein [Novosphingobium resinovorum]